MDEPLLKPDVDPPVRLWRLASWLLNQAAARANRLVGGQLGKPGARTQYAVLAGLDQFGALSQAELSRRLGIDRGDAVAVLNGLEREGLARREPDRTDRRRNTVHITPAGRDKLFEFDVLVDAAQDELLAPLSPAERGQLNALLRQLIERPGGSANEPARSKEEVRVPKGA
jgi:DNA-binding MarR family transcriptional regulator